MGGRVGWDVTLAAMLLAFAASTVIATVYTLTYQGVGYLKTFVQTLALGGVVSAVVMLAVGDDVARGLGMVGALTLIRFRATLKDTRDLVFLFASLGVGVACGVQAFAPAILGTLAFSAAAVVLGASGFGARQRFDAVLRFRAPGKPETDSAITALLDRHCREASLVDVRGSGGGVQEYAYHLRLVSPGADVALVRALEGVEGVEDAAMFKQDATLEL
jgi:hypothetical protein